MRIHAIRVNNFRAFFGEHEIVFPHDKNKHINIVLAQNEVGKTTLLSAILFCFFNRLTDSSEDKEILLNIEALRKGKKSGYCEVDIIHPNDLDDPNPDIYKIRRNFNERGSDQLPFATIEDGITGEQSTYRDPYNLINSLIPEPIADYFFIDGEGIHNIVGSEELLRNAIRNIQGLNAAEDAKLDLLKEQKKKNSNVNQILKQNKEAESINTKIEAKEKQIEKLEKEKAPLEKALATKDSDIRKIRIKLKNQNIGDIDILVKREEALKQDINKTIKALESIAIDKKKLSGKFSRHIFSYKFITNLDKFIDEKGSIGELPSGYEEIFVQRLLAKKVCICGKKFSEHSSEYKHIEQLLSDAKTQEFENKMFSIRKKTSDFINKIDEYGPAMQSIQESILDLQTKLKNDEKELQDNLAQQRSFNQKEIKKLRQTLDTLEVEHFKLNRSVGVLTGTLDASGKELSKLYQQKGKLMKQVVGLESEQKEIEFLNESIKYLEELIIQTEEDGKKEIDFNMNELLSKHARGNSKFRFKPGTYSPMILNDLNEEEDDDEDTLIRLKQPLSAGGAAVKRNIFFACSLINQSKNRIKADEELIIPGTSAPMVVDAPFSNLDSFNTEMVAKLLFDTADQLIIFMSNSAWNGIQQLLKDKSYYSRLNSVHYLTRSFRTKAKGRESLPIDINGKLRVDSMIYDQDQESTEIHVVDEKQWQ